MRSLIFLLLIFHSSIAFVQKHRQIFSKKELTFQLKENQQSLFELKNQINDLSIQVIELRYDIRQVNDSLEHYKNQLKEITRKDNSLYSTITTSTTVRDTNPFGTGGNDGGTSSEEGTGGGRGSATGSLGGGCQVGLILTINSEGIVMDCRQIKSVTTCTNQSVINDAIRRAKQRHK